MNCPQIETLLPLYVGADLTPRETEAVRTHLAMCADCRAQVEALAASQAWLQAVPPPEFDEAFFAGLRGGVRRAIAATERQPRWFERLFAIWPWQWVGAAALALVLLMLALNWSRLLPAGHAPQESAKVSVTPTPVPVEPERKTPSMNPNALAHRTGQSVRSVERSVPVRQKASNEAAVVARNPVIPAPVNAVRPSNDSTPETLVAKVPEMTRIELQTADPNIRIIWLTPKTTVADASAK